MVEKLVQTLRPRQDHISCVTSQSLAVTQLIASTFIRTWQQVGIIGATLEVSWMCRYEPGMRPPYPQRSFQNHWDARCEGEWSRAFYLFTTGQTFSSWTSQHQHNLVSLGHWRPANCVHDGRLPPQCPFPAVQGEKPAWFCILL